MDQHEDEPRSVSPAALEMLPSRGARKLRHDFGRPSDEIVQTRGSPKLSHQAQADEFASFCGRQPEFGRELKKEIDVLGPNAALQLRAATKELEPPCVCAMGDVVTSATRCHLVDEPLRAVEALPTELRGEMLP